MYIEKLYLNQWLDLSIYGRKPTFFTLKQKGRYDLNTQKTYKGVSLLRMNYLTDITSLIQIFGSQKEYTFLEFESLNLNQVQHYDSIPDDDAKNGNLIYKEYFYLSDTIKMNSRTVTGVIDVLKRVGGVI